MIDNAIDHFNSFHSIGFVSLHLTLEAACLEKAKKRFSSCIVTKGTIRILQPNTRLTVTTVPIIVVVTKFDLYIADMQRRAGMKNKISYKSAEDDFRKEFGHTFDKNSASQGQIRYALVSSTFMSRLRHLH